MGLAFAGLFAGGVIFALLRLRTRNLAAAVLAHWLFDAGLITGLFFLTRS
jgi:membrane protease YdiL (CAAX protease family)